MKKIWAIIFLLMYLTSCWNTNNINQNNTSTGSQNQDIQTSTWAQQAAQETLEEIENTPEDDLSQALKDFLAQDSIDYKAEIQKTLERYNDNYWPVLEYKHVAKPVEQTQDEEINWEENPDEDSNNPDEEKNSDPQEQQDSADDEEISDDKNYSGEVDLGDEDDEDQNQAPEFTSITKIWKSGTYISYTPQSGKCNGGLKMVDNDENEKWLFYNTCDKIIYDFELDFWGINVFFKDENGTEWETFVTIE